MAPDEITWLARPQIHLSFSPHFYALRVRRRRYASAPAFFIFLLTSTCSHRILRY